MKLSELVKNKTQAPDYRGLVVVSFQELLSITEFDNQPERSKREDVKIDDAVL